MSNETRFPNTVLLYVSGMQSYVVFVHTPTAMPPFERSLYAADELAYWSKPGFTGQYAFLSEPAGAPFKPMVAYLPCYQFFDKTDNRPEDFSWTKP